MEDKKQVVNRERLLNLIKANGSSVAQEARELGVSYPKLHYTLKGDGTFKENEIAHFVKKYGRSILK